MAVVQSTYSEAMTAAVAGHVANMELSNAITRAVEDEAGIGFGKAVFQGTADKEITATASAAFVGITVKDVTVENDDAADEYAEGVDAAVLTQGVIWVTAGGDVEAGEAAGVAADGDFEESASGITMLSGVTFVDSGADGDLVRIRLK
ncbi:structural cement protein Gp24 [Euryhalocaulis caribicus]|uniref:structural cement protein Gp24 n=1 Tax=Euryhalocaulis caribicus TaxID=1161401 RepID=UPI00039A8EB4|nr:hypothetical protein [Euryhalocaulis caribicus]